MGVNTHGEAVAVVVDAEATIRSGKYSSVDQDEAEAGFIQTKYVDSLGHSVRHSYYQFDLADHPADLTQPATVTFYLSERNGSHAVQVWVLDQGYDEFTPEITWDTAQANDTASNGLLTSGQFTATKLGGVQEIRGKRGSFSATIPTLSSGLYAGKIIFVLTGAAPVSDGFTNRSGGLRVKPGAAELDFAHVTEPE